MNDLTALVERPVIYSVIRQLQDYTGISSKTNIRYLGQEASAAQWNSTLTKDSVIHNKWPVMESLIVEVEEDFNPDRILNMVVKTPENPFIFLDSDLGFYIKPAYSTQDITIRFKYKAKDKNQANRWRNEIRTRVAMNRAGLAHTLTYSYHLPEVYLLLIDEIHRRREALGGYGDTFDQYLAAKSTNRLTALSNQSGSRFIYSIAETQAGVIGYFDFEGFPDKAEKDGDNDNFEISFSYKFKYEKPIETVCKYPFLVHQQFIDEKYIVKPAYDLTSVFKRLTSSGEDFSYFQIENINDRNMADKGVVIPHYDEFFPTFIAPFTVRALSVLLTISNEDKRSLLNLGDLGDFNFRSELKSFISTEAQYLPKVGGSVLYCQLYENENVMEDGAISVDSSLNVSATFDLDVRKQYRIRLSLIADLSMLSSQAVKRLKADKTVLDCIVNAINAALGNSGNQFGLYKNSLTKNEMRLLGYPTDLPNLISSSLVQYMYVMAAPMGSYEPAAAQPVVLNNNLILGFVNMTNSSS